MTVTSKIRKHGGAAVMTIPPALLKLMDVDIGAQVTLTVEDRKLIAALLASTRRRYFIDELLKGGETIKRLNGDVALARDGDPIGREFDKAEQRMAAVRETGYAVSASYDGGTSRVIVELSTGVQISFPAKIAEGLSNASPEDLVEIEISPAGLGLHWPKLDADVYVPALLGAMIATRALAGLEQVLSPQQAADWLDQSRGVVDDAERDPLA